MPNKPLRARVIAALIEAGLTQLDIACELQITPQAVSAVVRGERANPRIRALIAERTGREYMSLWGEAPPVTRVVDLSTTPADPAAP